MNLSGYTAFVIPAAAMGANEQLRGQAEGLLAPEFGGATNTTELGTLSVTNYGLVLAERKLIAVAPLITHPDAIDVPLLTVAKESRKKGAGTELLGCIATYALQEEIDSVRLVVEPKRLAMRAFVQKRGFKPSPRQIQDEYVLDLSSFRSRR